ncbi:response regulator [bacterium]|nr:response regulator [bacterium]
MVSKPVVYVVDDDDLARRSVCALVQSMGISAVSFASAEEFLNAYEPDAPGCLVTDVRMLGMSGLELQQELIDRAISLPVIVMTAFPRTPMTVEVIQKGAVTVLEKPYVDDDLWDAIRKALALDKDVRQQREEQERVRQRFALLTDREVEVLNLIMEGRSNKQIAAALKVSIRTVENRRSSIFARTQTSSLAELIQLRLSVDRSQHDD